MHYKAKQNKQTRKEKKKQDNNLDFVYGDFSGQKERDKSNLWGEEEEKGTASLVVASCATLHMGEEINEGLLE